MRTIVNSESPTKMLAVQPKAIKVVQSEENLRSDPREMQIVPVHTNEFQLPDDWIVEVRPRGPKSSVKMSDKYYYEPGSGRQFRSLLSVKRYLSGEDVIAMPRKKRCNTLVPYHNLEPFRRIAYGGKILTEDEFEEASQATSDDDFYPETLQPKSSCRIPDGWIVEEIPRRSGYRSDRYYIEPGTGKRFRSVLEVERYLAAHRFRCRALTLNNHSKGPRSPAQRKKNTSIKMFRTSIVDLANPPEKINWGPRSPAQRKKNTSIKMFRTSIVDLANPPEKINWVYSGDGRDNWSPLVEECALPHYVKEQWAETFLLGMNGWKHRIPQLTMGESDQLLNA